MYSVTRRVCGDGADSIFTSGGGGQTKFPDADQRRFGQPGTHGIRFALDGNQAKATAIWPFSKDTPKLGQIPGFWQGRLFTGDLAELDRDTGAAKAPGSKKMNAYHGWILAGGHAYGIPKSGGKKNVV